MAETNTQHGEEHNIKTTEGAGSVELARALEVAIGIRKYTRQRAAALETVRTWLADELKWMRDESLSGQPWGLYYCSVTNRTGRLVCEYDSMEAAEADLGRANASASFGWYEVRQLAREPLDEPPETASRFMTFVSRPDGSFDITFDPA